MNPPSGCPFQTRCRWKAKVPGNKCETEVPPMVTLASGHQAKCHLSREDFESMEPVIKIAAE
jgi:peptide/nickel transport system ATP-binding protein